MELFERNPAIFLLVSLNYLLVAAALYHLIFRSDYSLTQRLLWMAALWLLPGLGILSYWLVWYRRAGRI